MTNDTDVPESRRGDASMEERMKGDACARCARINVALIDGDLCGRCRMEVVDGIKDRQEMIGLYRLSDESGVSGEGLVATGVRLPDGSVAIQWLNDERGPDTRMNGWALYPGEGGVEDALAVHGHEGRTKLIVLHGGI